MSLPRRDVIATVLVAAGVVLYVLWLAGAVSSVPAAAAVVLGLGFAASASAVVPGFDELLHFSKVYLIIASLIGLLALLAGILALANADGAMLTVLVAATAVLWVMATIRHVRLAARSGSPQPGTSQYRSTRQTSTPARGAGRHG